jgi:DNA polymerase III sliding clamp (beta) subunit (PCNA family)
VIINVPDRQSFLKNFLLPISKINDGCVIEASSDGFSCLTATADSSVILFNKFNNDLDIEQPINLNIADIKKIIKVVECVEGESLSLNVDKNNINYNGNGIKFKYHLLEDGIITAPKLSIKKLTEIEFPIAFTLPYKTIVELLKGSTFATESNKLYFYSENGKVFGDLTDRARHNVDSFTLPVCDYSGPSFTEICLNFELIRIISGVRVKELQCKINPKLGVVIFEVTDKLIQTKYIASALIK